MCPACASPALRLRVFASSDRLRSSGDVDPVGQMVWETAIDMKTLTALPEGLRLSDLGALPADCLLLEMSKGGLYVPGEEGRVLESEVMWLLRTLSHWLAFPPP